MEASPSDPGPDLEEEGQTLNIRKDSMSGERC